MKYRPVRDRCCQNEKCQEHLKLDKGNIIRHSKYRLHKSRGDFDKVVQMTVEGVGISSISRIKCFSWNTIFRWQYLACQAAGEFNNQNLKDIELIEFQADEICTFTGIKKKPMWIFVAIEVWSRIWISKVVGSRNYRNIKTLLNQVIDSCRIVNPFIFTTDGFEPFRVEKFTWISA